MKFEMRKFVLVVLVFIILLSACQPGEQPETIPLTTETQRPTPLKNTVIAPTFTPTATQVPDWYVDEADLAGVQLSFLHPWDGDAIRQLQILVDTFNQTNEWGIFVEVFDVGGSQQVFQQTEKAIQSGQAPNVVIAPIEELTYWRGQDRLVVLDPYLSDETYGMDAEEQAAYYPLFWEQDVVNQERLGVPASRSARVLVYNHTWAQEMGYVVVPQTALQFKNQVCAAQDALLKDNRWQNDGLGGIIVDRNEYTILSWLSGFGIADFHNQPVYEFDQEETKEGLSYLREIFDDGCAWNARNPTPFEYFANREALFYATSVEELLNQSQAMTLAENEDSWTLIAFPDQDGKPQVLVFGSSYGIIKNSPQEDLASWLFIRWMNEDLPLKQVAGVLESYPVTTELLKNMARTRSPQWNTAVDLLENAQSAPSGSWWRVGRFVLPDAVYQLYSAAYSEDQLDELLTLLDETVETLNSMPASPGWE